MSISIFLSGVSSEFSDQRKQLASDLDRLRNLGISPVGQENLSEKVTISASLVEKLVANVQACELAFCMIGFKAGYPEKLEERLRIQKLAEAHLERAYSKKLDQLGELWLVWSKLELGMTYTQLEFFLAASAFRERIRVRVYRHDWSTISQTSGVEPNFQKFLDFLEQRREQLDWTTLTQVSVDALCLAADFAFLRRDSEDGVSTNTQSHEAIERGISVLEDHLKRKTLTIENYQEFYNRYVCPRLYKDLIVIHVKSLPQSIGDQVKAIYALSTSEHFFVLVQLPTSLEVLCFEKEQLRMLERFLYTNLQIEEQIYAYEPTSKLLLTYEDKQGFVVRKHCGISAVETFISETIGLAPDPFSTTLGITGIEKGRPWFAINQNETWTRVRQLDDLSWVKDTLGAATLNILEPVYIQLAPFTLPGRTTDAVRLMMNKYWGRLSEDTVLVLDETDGEKQLRIQRFKVVPTGSLFLEMESKWIDGPFFERIEIKTTGQQTSLCLKTSSMVHEFPMDYDEPSTFSMELRLSRRSVDVPKNSRSALSSKGDLLVVAESQSEKPTLTGAEKTRLTCFRFQMPLGLADAINYFKKLRRQCRGQESVQKQVSQ